MKFGVKDGCNTPCNGKAGQFCGGSALNMFSLYRVDTCPSGGSGGWCDVAVHVWAATCRHTARAQRGGLAPHGSMGAEPQEKHSTGISMRPYCLA